MKKVLGLCLCFVLSVVCMGCDIEYKDHSVNPTPEVQDTIGRKNKLLQQYNNSELFKNVKIDKNNSIDVQDEIAGLLSENQKSFSVENKKYMRKKNNGKMDVNYPFFKGQGKNIKALNKCIKDTLNDEEILGFDAGGNDVDAKLKYQIKTELNDFVSILFSGFYNIHNGKNVFNLSFTINYDLKDNKQIYLYDSIKIDEPFLEKVRGAIEDQLEPKISEAYCKLKVDDFYNQFKDKSQGFYFNDGNIYVRVKIPYGTQYMDYVGFQY